MSVAGLVLLGACSDGGEDRAPSITCGYAQYPKNGECTALPDNADFSESVVSLRGELGNSPNGARTAVWTEDGAALFVGGYGLSNGVTKGWVAKYVPDADKTLKLAWTAPSFVGTTGESRVFALAPVDGAGSAVCAAGWVYGPVESGVSALGNGDGYVTCFSGADGSAVSSSQFGTSGFDASYALAVDSGQVYVAGVTAGKLGATAFGKADGVILRATVTAGGELGAFEVLGQYGTAEADALNAVAVDGTAVYAGGKVTTSEGENFWLVRQPLSGTATEWTGSSDGKVSDSVAALALNSGGDLFVLGQSLGKVGAAHLGASDAVLMRFAADDLTRTDLLQFGTELSDRPRGLTLQAEDTLLVVGDTAGTFPQAAAAGGWDAFVARVKYTGADSKVEPVQFGTPADDTLFAVSTAPSRPLVVAGESMGNLVGRSLALRETLLRFFTEFP